VAEVHRNRLLLAPQTQPVTPQWSATPLAPADLLATAYDGHHAIVVDADRLKFPLSVRLWQPGDRFVPFGMERHRLVSDFLKDLHLSRIEKQHVFLLVDANETPVWIIGLRPDNRCRISSATCHPQAISLII
jgi:tRNA(Ile)-lysidine synthase